MKLKSVQRYDRSICFGFVGATFQGADGDVEDEDAELCDTEEEEEPRRKEPKKDKGSNDSRGLLEIWLNTLHP